MTPAHGTYSRYTSADRCRCDKCRQAAYVYMKRYSHHRSTHGYVLQPADEALALVQAYLSQGWSYASIAQATGLALRHLQHITRGEVTRVNRRTIHQLRNPDWSAVDGATLVPAWPVARRLRALQALGWTWTLIADRAGLAPTHVQRIHQQQRCTAAARQAVIAVYDTMSMETPPDIRATRCARTYAARRGYAPPLAWDNIDDPDEQPQGIAPAPADTRRTIPRGVLVETCEEIGDLADTCRALGMTGPSIYRALSRAGRTDLWLRLNQTAGRNAA